jgi:GPI-anchor transamidase subunit U
LDKHQNLSRKEKKNIFPLLVPYLGLFWYFFTEMFDHFRLFFTYVFQMNTLIYAIPLTIRLRNQPIVNIIVQIGLLSVLKSYPNVGETGYYLSFCGSGGGNANFYFAITIVYSVRQIFLLVDILYSHLKREFIMINGSDEPKYIDILGL